METTINLPELITARLEDLADQVEYLFRTGKLEEAQLLRDEGLQLAQAYDNGENFFFLQDLSTL